MASNTRWRLFLYVVCNAFCLNVFALLHVCLCVGVVIIVVVVLVCYRDLLLGVSQ